MRLLKLSRKGKLTLTEDLPRPPGPYAILSHTWGADEEEVTFGDLEKGLGKGKAGYTKLQFCASQAKKDGLRYFWVDTCCINKANLTELDEAIRSMFRWYQEAYSCYVYLTDVSSPTKPDGTDDTWIPAFYKSRWFRRGWTLQELLAPKMVQFYSREEILLGTKNSLEQRIHEITRIPLEALKGVPLSQFPPEERLRWAEHRETKKVEDNAYSLLGVFQISMSLRYGEGDDAMKRLKEKINKANMTSPEPIEPTGPKHVHWVVSRSANTWFTGREDVLQELGAVIDGALAGAPSEQQCQIVLSGMGGQGKSELCLQIANRFRQRFWAVFWVDVSTASTAEVSFLQLARMLNLPAQSLGDARMHIENLQHPWLMVLDNADDPDTDYQPYFPHSPWGVVMMTSRNEETHQYATAKAIVLEGLSVDAARDLLMKAARVPAEQHSVLQEDATRVATLVQSHPLALIQAGAYVARGGCLLSQYPAVYSQQRRRLLEFRPSQAQSRYRDVYATFEASADALKQSPIASARDALDLLPLLAVGAAINLPLVVFKAAWKRARSVPSGMEHDPGDEKLYDLTGLHVAHLPPFLDVSPTAWDESRLAQAVQQLKSFALVTTDMSSTSMNVSMHPLVHAWARDRQNVDEQHKNWLSMACIMVLAWRNHSLNHTLDRQLQAHFESIIEWSVDTMFANAPSRSIVRVLVQCGWILHNLRRDEKLRALMKALVDRLDLDETTVEREWLGLYTLAGSNLTYSSMPKKAIPLLEQVVELQKESRGAKGDLQFMRSGRSLAVAYRKVGQTTKAIEVLEDVVSIESETLAVDSEQLLILQHELATLYRQAGRSDEALLVLEDVVKIQKEAQAADYPQRLRSQHDLARMYYDKGQIKKAVKLMEEVVGIRAKTVEVDDSDRLSSQHELAKIYFKSGRTKEAIIMMEEVVRNDAETLKRENPERLSSQHVLAKMYYDNGQPKEAVTLMEEVVRIREQTSDAGDSHLLASQFYLSRGLWKLGKRERACQLMGEVAEQDARVKGADDPDRLLSEEYLKRFQREMRISEEDDSD